MRSFSLVLLRRLLFRPMPFTQGVPRQQLYDHLAEQTRDTLERVVLSCLQNEADDSVRKKVADTICDLAKGSLERGRPWEALQVQTFTATRSPNAGHREAAYRIFTYVPQIALSQEMNAVIDVFDRGLQDPESLNVCHATRFPLHAALNARPYFVSCRFAFRHFVPQPTTSALQMPTSSRVPAA